MRSIAYFSMEIGLDPEIRTYAGGLGVLAGDTLKSAADLELPMVGVSLLYKEGHFWQNIETGEQQEEPQYWNVNEHLERMDERISLSLEGREVHVGLWEFVITGVTGGKVVIYFMDTDLEENDELDRGITRRLYPHGSDLRLKQEAILGIGGVRMLQALDYSPEIFHMNEGHSALLALELLQQFDSDEEAVRNRCVFTTHTPVAAGHDKFNHEDVGSVFAESDVSPELMENYYHEGQLNMTYLALAFSHFVNGVSHRHSEVSTDLFPNYEIDSITNGVHPKTWVGDAFQEVFDAWLPRWQRDPFVFRNIFRVPENKLLEAHAAQKTLLLEDVEDLVGVKLDTDVMTLGFARRMTLYKRPTLIFHDIERLRKIAEDSGPLQILFAGKSHPEDEEGKALLKELLERQNESSENLKIVFIPDYGMREARLLTGGVDLWLNTPSKPHEASGTSGMKAALNGVPQLSVCDGWWLEGHIENITGWSIGSPAEDVESDDADDAGEIYHKLESVILPCFYEDKTRWAAIMKNCIGLNGSFFQSNRMLQQYVLNSYLIEQA